MIKTTAVSDIRVRIEGSGEQTIVMLHGWPDTAELWRPQIDFFKQDYRCVSFTMPGFSPGERSDYSLDDVVTKIAEVIDAVSPHEKVILLTHDWGCVFGYEYAMRFSHRIEKMIGLDVGDADSQELQNALSAVDKLMVFTYQIILAISFVCPRPVGNPIAKFVATVLQARSIKQNIHAGMSMPYAMRWFGMNGGLTNLLPVEPTFPFYYAYGVQKPMMFHSPEWIQRVLESPHNKVEAFDSGHWLMVDKAQELNESMAQWLSGSTSR